MSKHKNKHHKHHSKKHNIKHNDVVEIKKEKVVDDDNYQLISRIIDVITKTMFKLSLSDSIYFMEARKQLIQCVNKRKEYNEEKFRLANYRKEWAEMKARETKKEKSLIRFSRSGRVKRLDVSNHDIKNSVASQIENAMED